MHREVAQRRIKLQQNIAIGKDAEGYSADLIGEMKLRIAFCGIGTLRISATREIGVPKEVLRIATMQFAGHRCVESSHGD